MNKLLLTISALFITTISFGQIRQTKYYKNERTKRKVAQEKARFVQTTIRNPDSSITTEDKDINTSKVIHSETYKGKEPTGIWIYKYKSIYDGLVHLDTLDYSFNLVYSHKPCDDSITGLKDFSKDNDSLKYHAPKISGTEQTLMGFLVQHVFYPDGARDHGIQGKVILTFTIDANGNIENIVVKKGVNILLDKEAVRVMRLLKLSTPPMLNGKPAAMCITMPMSFTLQ